MMTPPNPLKTPASEAMENNDRLLMEHSNALQRMLAVGVSKVGVSQNALDYAKQRIAIHETIRTALKLLDLVQSGKAKVLKREPTEKMEKTTYHMHDSRRVTWQKFWDAAEPMPQDEGDGL